MGNQDTIVKQSKSTSLQLSDGQELLIINEKEAKKTLDRLVKDYGKLKVTEENLEEGKKARMIIREHRYDLQNISKGNVTVIENAKKMMKSSIEGLIDIIQPVEDRIDSDIKAIEERVKREKEENEKAEKARIEKITGMINEFREKLEEKIKLGNTRKDIIEFSVLIAELKEKKGSFEEFEFEADDLLIDFEDKVSVILGRVEDAENVQKQKEEYEKKQKEIEEEKKEIEEEKKKNIKIKVDSLVMVLEATGFVLNNTGTYEKDGRPLIDVERLSDNDVDATFLKEQIKNFNELPIKNETAKNNVIESVAKDIEKTSKNADKKIFDSMIDLVHEATANSLLSESTVEGVAQGYAKFCEDIDQAIKKFSEKFA